MVLAVDPVFAYMIVLPAAARQVILYVTLISIDALFRLTYSVHVVIIICRLIVVLLLLKFIGAVFKVWIEIDIYLACRYRPL